MLLHKNFPAQAPQTQARIQRVDVHRKRQKLGVGQVAHRPKLGVSSAWAAGTVGQLGSSATSLMLLPSSSLPALAWFNVLDQFNVGAKAVGV
jgi:hypothetical protein